MLLESSVEWLSHCVFIAAIAGLKDLLVESGVHTLATVDMLSSFTQ